MVYANSWNSIWSSEVIKNELTVSKSIARLNFDSHEFPMSVMRRYNHSAFSISSQALTPLRALSLGRVDCFGNSWVAPIYLWSMNGSRLALHFAFLGVCITVFLSFTWIQRIQKKLGTSGAREGVHHCIHRWQLRFHHEDRQTNISNMQKHTTPFLITMTLLSL